MLSHCSFLFGPSQPLFHVRVFEALEYFRRELGPPGSHVAPKGRRKRFVPRRPRLRWNGRMKMPTRLQKVEDDDGSTTASNRGPC